MEVICATCQGLTEEPFSALFGDAVTIFIGELPDAGGGGDVERTGVPHGSFGEGDFISEDGAGVEGAVGIRISEADDPMSGVFELFGGFVIGAGGIGDVEASQFVEIGVDGAVDEGGLGDEFDLKAIGESEGLSIEGDLVVPGREAVGVIGSGGDGSEKNLRGKEEGDEDQGMEHVERPRGGVRPWGEFGRGNSPGGRMRNEKGVETPEESDGIIMPEGGTRYEREESGDFLRGVRSKNVLSVQKSVGGTASSCKTPKMTMYSDIAFDDVICRDVRKAEISERFPGNSGLDVVRGRS